MNRTAAADLQPGAVSGGLLWLVGAALALTQLTSLALGPAVNRQLQVSLSVPAVELDDAPGAVGPGADSVLGTIVTALPSDLTSASVVAHRQPSSSAEGSLATTPPTVAIKKEPAASSTPSVTRAEHSGHDDRGVERRTGRVAGGD